MSHTAEQSIQTGELRLRGKSAFQRFRDQLDLQSMILPGFAAMIVFHFLPLFGLVIAFKDYQIISGLEGFFTSEWVGLKHFAAFFTDPKSGQVILNTVAMSFLGIAVRFPIIIAFALFLNEIQNMTFKRTVQTVSYLPHFISWVIFGGLVLRLLSPESGVINELLIALGVIDEPLFFVGEPSYFWFLAVLSNLAKEIGWSAILYLAAMAGISPHLYEAATVDGANRFQKMWHITLPGIKGTIVILLLLAFANFIRESFDQIWVLQNPLNVQRSEIISTYVFKIGIMQMRFSYAAAVGLFQSVTAVTMLVVANWFSNRVVGKGLF
jgi:putative aldouronate transport system permease protein